MDEDDDPNKTADCWHSAYTDARWSAASRAAAEVLADAFEGQAENEPVSGDHE